MSQEKMTTKMSVIKKARSQKKKYCEIFTSVRN